MKVLIIRFSSIGDLTQALSIPSFIRSYVPEAEIHFVTREDLSPLVANHPQIKKVWSLNRKAGFRGLITLIAEMRKEKFTHIYDAHNNLRSFFIRSLIFGPKKLVRPMMRLKRFLLLRFHINLFEKPFSGQRDLIKPLEKWGMPFRLPPTPQIFFNDQVLKHGEHIREEYKLANYYVLVPSAAYELKRWPVKSFEKLIELNPQNQFVVLAGPEDHFTKVFEKYSNVVNLTGKTNLLQSAAVIKSATAVVSNDTGLLHISEQLGKPTIALMGPAPFGFPSRGSTVILERDLKCRPCSKHGQGPCINPNFQECLQSISAEEVSERLSQLK